eukprot:COSAG06_NODE_55088_length_291_cov_0.807292_1_plen_29_part_10
MLCVVLHLRNGLPHQLLLPPAIISSAKVR